MSSHITGTLGASLVVRKQGGREEVVAKGPILVDEKGITY